MSSGESNNDLEKLRSEMQRQIDHQIDTVRHYEKLAWNIFRTQTTLGGLLLSSLIFIATYANVAANVDELPNIPVPTYESATTLLASQATPFSDELGTLFLAILLIVITLVSIFGVVEFFCFPIWRAYNIQAPERLSSGADWTNSHFEVNFDEGFDNNIIKIYSQSVSHNENIVAEIKDSWSHIFQHMVWGIAHFSTLVIITLFLILDEPLMIIFAILFSSFALIFYIMEFLEMHDMWGYLRGFEFTVYSEIGVIALATAMFFEIATILPITSIVVVLSTLVCIISIILVGIRIDAGIIFDIVTRNIGIFGILFIFIGSYTSSMGILGVSAPTITSLLVGSVTASLLVYSGLLFGLATIKKSLSVLRNTINQIK